MKKIDNLILCVGAQKAGTTWLYSLLKSSPDVKFFKYKEVHYFDYVSSINKQLLNRSGRDVFKSLGESLHEVESERKDDVYSFLDRNLNDEWYVSVLSSESAVYSADFTPEYALLDENQLEKVWGVSENCKIIFIMRDPVERTKSAMQYFYQNKGRDLGKLSEGELIHSALSPIFLNRSLYEKTIHALDSTFEDVLYLFYEEVMADKMGAISKLEDFLNIDLSHIDKTGLDKKVNKSDQYSFGEKFEKSLRYALSYTYDSVLHRFGYVPDEWKKEV
ncbi:sulfotransferase [Halomonas sp. I1]|uniref:sulfotransferase domain-containing protein n=1 Tax=Halomonas sp. I1 TaxID=393536 RepID=UPI0028DE0681|nr:sulfotransferase domain-containing protein [Halomonas sp. I1]MDT8893924.1 sulfotransferase [Halomonas sp. I1]